MTTTIGDLPEDVLVELLSLVPARDLTRGCRAVCRHWRYVVDLNTLWKRKCQREGFCIQNSDRSISDWKIFYMLSHLKKNLIKNPCAEENFQHWKLDKNGGDGWKVEELPGDHGTAMPDLKAQKYFVTSFGPCYKSQLICLKKEGYWDQLMDEKRPEIVVKDWYAARYDCGCRYELTVRLLSEDYIVLEEFHPEPVVIEQWSDAMWREISHTFQNYPAGVRYIWFQHGGQDTQFWAGWYGIRVTNSSITIGPQTLLGRHETECLLLPQDCSEVVSGAPVCQHSLGECPESFLHSSSQAQAVHSRTSAGPALCEDFCLQLASSCTMDVTAITGALPQEDEDS